MPPCVCTVVYSPGMPPCVCTVVYIARYASLVGIYRVVYSLVCLPGGYPSSLVCFPGGYPSSLVCLPVCLPSRPPPCTHASLYTVYTHMTAPSTASMCTVVQDFKEERHIGAERCPFLLQNKPSFPGETSLKGHRNPPQKAPAHKELLNIPTPPELSSNPPRCPGPPVHTAREGQATPCPEPGF